MRCAYTKTISENYKQIILNSMLSCSKVNIHLGLLKLQTVFKYLVVPNSRNPM